PQSRRLENRLGPHPFPRFPRHADDYAVHLAGLRFAARSAACPRPCALHAALRRARRKRTTDAPLQFLQEPARHHRTQLSRAIPDARTVGPVGVEVTPPRGGGSVAVARALNRRRDYYASFS